MLWNFVITISGEEATKKVRFRRRVEVRLLPEGRDVENQMRGEVQVRRKGMQLFATISHIIDGRCVRPRQQRRRSERKKKPSKNHINEKIGGLLHCSSIPSSASPSPNRTLVVEKTTTA